MYKKDENGQYFFNGNRMLISYIRGAWISRRNPFFRNDPNHEPLYIKEFYWGPIGLTCAVLLGDEVRYGYSRVNIRAGDKFCREQSLKMALGRALTKNIKPPFESEDIPLVVKPDLEKMYGRAKNYFRH